MPLSLPRLSCLSLAAGLFAITQVAAQTSAQGADFSGIWQLNDKQSDSAAVITQRLHAEKRHEQASSSRPASASSSGAPVAASNGGFGGRGGGRGMGGAGAGGGHMGGGRHGNHDAPDSSSNSKSAPPKDPTPPLLADDSFLNVQQNSQGLRVDYNNTDRLDTRFDGMERQSLNSNARVRTQLTPGGMDVSLAFDDGTRLKQTWARSADGHHLTITETWWTNDLQEPIVFKRSYDRLDL